MKLLMIVGPSAVGKMTVGKHISRKTGLKLFHNHMSIDLVHHFFDFGTAPFRKLDEVIRFSIFETVASSDLPGLIFTVVPDFDDPEDKEYIERIRGIFHSAGGTSVIAELSAPLEVRLKRNVLPDRLQEKPLKRNLALSEKILRNEFEHHRTSTQEGEFQGDDYLRLDTSEISAEEAADQIIEYFQLGVLNKKG